MVGLLLTGNPVSPADCREILLPMMTDQLKYHLERQEDLEACCQLLSNILEVLYRKDVVSNGGAAPRTPREVSASSPREPWPPRTKSHVIHLNRISLSYIYQLYFN